MRGISKSGWKKIPLALYSFFFCFEGYYEIIVFLNALICMSYFYYFIYPPKIEKQVFL